MFEYIRAFNFSHEILQTKSKKLEINLNIEIGRGVLSTVSVSRKNYGTTYVIMFKNTG